LLSLTFVFRIDHFPEGLSGVPGKDDCLRLEIPSDRMYLAKESIDDACGLSLVFQLPGSEEGGVA
jgi:hypothetical protein